MTLRDRIDAGLRSAVQERRPERVSVLRLILAAVRDRDIAARGADETHPGVGDDVVRQILGRMIRQRQESARAYEEGGRLGLAQAERDEIEVIEEFLPRPFSPAEVEAAIERAMAETGASSMRDMGVVMGALKARHAGRMDFGAAGARVRERLRGRPRA